ncbi:MAG: hypothetical protein R3F49_09775 [Planctomycetota bacterium]
MRITTSLLALAALLPLFACSTSGTADPMSAAEAALQSGDSSKAVSLLEGHIATLDKTSSTYREATILLCSALAEKKPAEAKDALLKLVEAQPTGVTPKDFKDVQSYLQTHEHYSVAVDLMDAGLKRWKDDPTMNEVKDALVAKIKGAGDAEAMAKLKGLGYM